jgi:hypothetical protein
MPTTLKTQALNTLGLVGFFFLVCFIAANRPF